MSPRKQSQGECVFCGREMTKGGLSRHLKTFMQRQEAIKAVESEEKASQKQRLYGDPISLVNSPRLGMCGYDGPAEPPY